MSQTILAIDPGPEFSAWVILSGGNLEGAGYVQNDFRPHQISMLAVLEAEWCNREKPLLVIEQIKAMGMAVGAEVFETVFWSGRFAECWERLGGKWDRIGRADVKLHLCGSSRAKDGNVRQALIDRWGGDTRAIKGRKCSWCKGTGKVGRGKERTTCKHGDCEGGWEIPKGPLAGVSGDVWSALAVAVTYWDTKVKASATDQTICTLTRKN